MDEARLFSVVCSDWTRSNCLKLERQKFHPDIQKNFFMIKVMVLEQAAQRGCGASFYGDI